MPLLQREERFLSAQSRRRGRDSGLERRALLLCSGKSKSGGIRNRTCQRANSSNRSSPDSGEEDGGDSHMLTTGNSDTSFALSVVEADTTWEGLDVEERFGTPFVVET
jgi:hypothetical protein